MSLNTPSITITKAKGIISTEYMLYYDIIIISRIAVTSHINALVAATKSLSGLSTNITFLNTLKAELTKLKVKILSFYILVL